MRRERRPAPWVLGVDASLTRTALVLIPPDWVPGDWAALKVREISILGMPREECLDDLECEEYRVDRLTQIAARACDFVREHCCNRALRGYIESYAFSASSSSVTKLAELGGVLRVTFYTDVDLQLVLEPVTASSARKLLLGRLPQKDQKLAAQGALYRAGFLKERQDSWLSAEKRATRWVKECGDACDALIVGNAGRADLGFLSLTLGGG
jgi:hypothetical protein